MRAIIDDFLNHYLSRKLLVFGVASWGLFAGVITSQDWVTIAAVYIGTQGVIDAIVKLRNR